MYRVAIIVILVHSITVFTTIVLIIVNLARGSRIAQIMKTWQELQQFGASQQPEPRTQRYFSCWLQISSLFAVGSVAGAFLRVSGFFVDIMMLSSEEKKQFLVDFGPWMVRDFNLFKFRYLLLVGDRPAYAQEKENLR